MKDGYKANCRINNFSHGGLFLATSNKSALNIPPSTSVIIQIRTQRDTKEIQATTAHSSADGLGVAFVHQENELTLYLQRASTTKNLSQNIDNSASKPYKMGSKEVAIINWIQSAAKRFLKSRHTDFFKSANDTLFETANKADSNQTQNSLFDAYNTFRIHQDNIEHIFLDNINFSFNRYNSGSLSDDNSTNTLFQHQELDLVAKEDFEEWVSVVSLTRNLESSISSKLHQLENSLSFLAKRYINDEGNPVSPYSLLWSFKKSLSDLDITLQAKMVLFSSFQNHMLGDIDVLYDEINLYLDQQGITQQAKDKSINKQQKPTPIAKGPTQHKNGNTGKRLTDTLSSLIDFIGNKKTITSSKPTVGEAASKEVIVKSLANISATGQRPIIQKIEEQLSGEMTNGHQQVVLDSQSRQTIQVTEQLLGSLQQDTFMNREIHGLIESLKIPLVKEAINDPMLLNDTSHPGHKLLETIGKLGPYFPDEEQDKSRKGDLLHAFDEISILVEQGAQLNINEVTDQLERIIDKRKANLKTNLGIVTESCEQDEKYRAAKKHVFTLLCSQLLPRKIPLVVEELLQLGWVGLLVHTISTFGKKDKNSIRMFGVIDLLLDIFNTEKRIKPITKVQCSYLIQAIKVGFTKYPLYANEAKQYIEKLEAILESRGNRYPDIANKRVEIDKLGIKRLLDQQARHQAEDATTTHIEQNWLDLVRGIKLDDWIVEQRGPGHARMINLAWKNTGSTRYVFIDGKGTKRLDVEQHNLANMFKQRQCSLLEDGNIPIVERAVNRLLKNTFEQIKNESDVDNLTGLLRRNVFQRKISDLLDMTNDVGDHHIMLMLDIDQFSAINDLCGQKGGDSLLLTVSNIISNYLPEHATLARIGSDEFGALIKNCSPDEGYHIAETQRRALENLRHTWDGTAVPVTASIGIAHINIDTTSAAEVMNMASSSCQLAIEDGGNCTRLFSHADQGAKKQNRIVPNAQIIEEALRGQKLALHAQPISAVFIGDESEHHYEILMRVKNKDGNWEGPSDFIHAAEKCNRMGSIDRWVVNNTFTWLNNHHTEINNTGISINLSAQTMDDESFLNFINDHLDSTPFPNDKITFEITESSLIKHVEKARTLVEKIKHKGCKFSLDDFGTGYASYSYLKDFPVDHVKIDGVFIKDILTDSSSYAMVKSITEISHHMGKKVVAEYVESEAVLVALRELEVDFAQGYYIGEPVPIKNLLQHTLE